MTDIEETIVRLVQETFAGSDVQVSPDTTFDELSWDSLSMLELKMKLEDRLDVELSAEVFRSAGTIRVLASKVGAALLRKGDATAVP